MAPKVSISTQVSKTPSNSISFKNKRRRKFDPTSHEPRSSIKISSITDAQEKRCSSLQANKHNKSPKHRWKLNRNGCDDKASSDERRMTDDTLRNSTENRNFFQQQPSLDDSLHAMRNVDGKVHRDDGMLVDSYVSNVHSFDKVPDEVITRDAPSTSEKRKPRRTGIVNCRKFLEWTTSSGARKLLPIFILVNMLPFLYAGESDGLSYRSLYPVVRSHQQNFDFRRKCIRIEKCCASNRKTSFRASLIIY